MPKGRKSSTPAAQSLPVMEEPTISDAETLVAAVDDRDDVEEEDLHRDVPALVRMPAVGPEGRPSPSTTPRPSPSPVLQSPSDPQQGTRPSPTGAPPQKKRYRPSKRTIPDYYFDERMVDEVAEFVKNHPALYDKKHRHYSNPKMKESLWKELAATFVDCSYLQVRKFFENRRTDFGKIEKREFKSGAARRNRTLREEEIMKTWAFLSGHIAHEQTDPSASFGPGTSSQPFPPESSQEDPPAAVIPVDEPLFQDPEHVSSGESVHSGLSAHSIERRRRLREARTTPSGPAIAATKRKFVRAPPPRQEDPLTQAALKTILEQMNDYFKEKELSGHEKEVRTYCQHLGDRLLTVSRIHYPAVTTKLLEIVNAFSEPPIEEATRIADPDRVFKACGLVQATYNPPPAPAGPSYQQQYHSSSSSSSSTAAAATSGAPPTTTSHQLLLNLPLSRRQPSSHGQRPITMLSPVPSLSSPIKTPGTPAAFFRHIESTSSSRSP